MNEHMNPKPHLRHVRLCGYKSIKDLDLSLNPINLLIGANGAGKSNFISVFSFLRAISQGKFQSYVEDNGMASGFLHFGPKVTPEMMIDIDVNMNSYHAELSHDSYNDKLILKDESCRINSSSKTYKIKGKNGESGLADGDADSYHVRNYTKEYLDKCQVYHFHDTSKTAGFKLSQNVQSTDYLYPDAKNIAPFLYMLKQKWGDSYQDIVDAVKAVAPFFHDFYLRPNGEEGSQTILLKWLHKKSEEPFSAQQLSDGTARFICMATLFLQPIWLRPQTIILDEPEMGLHPAALEVLADIIKSVSGSTQVICSTQSVTFANLFEAQDFIVVDQKEGVSTFSRPDAKLLELWLDDYRMGDIWNKNLIGGRPKW